MVQIESRRGVDNVEDIARVDGLDGVLIGLFSLSPLLSLLVSFWYFFQFRLDVLLHDNGSTWCMYVN